MGLATARIMTLALLASCCTATEPLAQPTAADTTSFTVVSRGWPASPATCGAAVFKQDDRAFYDRKGCTVGGSRGWNVAAIDPKTGDLREPAQNFDTWYAGETAARAFIRFLDRQPAGTLLLIAVGDDAGMTDGRTAGCPLNPAAGTTCCRPLDGAFEQLRLALERLGAVQLRGYCYWNSYALITVKGEGAKAEQLGRPTEVTLRYALSIR